MRTRHSRLRRRGVSIVETAFVIGIALLFLCGLMEYARYLMILHTADNAAREGARYAVVHTGDGTTQSQVIAAVTAKMAGVDQSIQGYNVTVFTVDMTGIYNAAGGTYLYPSSPNLSQKPNSTWSDAQYGNAIAVQITGNYQPIMPSFLFLNASFPVQITSMMNSEAN
jgi:Flp pilus assembly protein TadG